MGLATACCPSWSICKTPSSCGQLPTPNRSSSSQLLSSVKRQPDPVHSPGALRIPSPAGQLLHSDPQRRTRSLDRCAAGSPKASCGSFHHTLRGLSIVDQTARKRPFSSLIRPWKRTPDNLSMSSTMTSSFPYTSSEGRQGSTATNLGRALL